MFFRKMLAVKLPGSILPGHGKTAKIVAVFDKRSDNATVSVRETSDTSANYSGMMLAGFKADAFLMRQHPKRRD